MSSSSSYTASLSQDQARSLFDQNGFLLVKNLPRGSDFGADGELWQVDRFSGVKFVPPGIHVFIFSEASSTKDSEGLGLSIRHAVIKRFNHAEIVSVEWDTQSEGFVNQLYKNDNISKEYIKTLDSQLAPFSFQNYAVWKGLVDCIDDDCLERVLQRQFNSAGSRTNVFMVDSTMMTVSDLDDIDQLGKKKKSKATTENSEHKDDERDTNTTSTKDNNKEEDVDLLEVTETLKKNQDSLLKFASFDIRRSWKPNAVGEELTRDFLDKTNLLKHVIKTQWNSDSHGILSEIQLSFVLSTFVHNFSCLDIYKRLVSLLLQSRTLLKTTSTSPSTPSYILVVKFLSLIFPGQLQAVRKNFFTEDLPGLDTFLHDQFMILRKNLWELKNEEEGEGMMSPEIWKELKNAWDIARKVTNERFGWELPSLDLPLTSSRTTRSLISHPTEVPQHDDDSSTSSGTARLYYDMWRTNRGEDDEYVEMGEDAPVIVIDPDTLDTLDSL